jgi:beta-galactosidase/beta-glucuronidase
MIEKTALNSGWMLSCNDTARPSLPSAIPATVPGCVHLDLLANRQIPDPYMDVNEITNDWIGRTDWTYRCSFEAVPDDGRVQDSSSTGSIRSRSLPSTAKRSAAPSTCIAPTASTCRDC